MSLKVKLLNERAKLPTKSHEGDLGYDLYACEPISIAPHGTELVPTGICIQFPPGYGGILKDRSSVASKQGLFVKAGVIDAGYIGEIKVLLYNSTDEWALIATDTKIAQMILVKTVDFTVEEVEEVFSLDFRGEAGFGSTGK